VVVETLVAPSISTRRFTANAPVTPGTATRPPGAIRPAASVHAASALVGDAVARLHCLAIAAVAACGASDPETPPQTFLAFSSTFAQFRDWPSFASAGPPDDGTFPPDVIGPRTQYINQLPPTGTDEFPVGTVIVEAREFGDHKLFAAVKRGGGFNAGGAVNWEWFEIQDPPVLIVWRGVGPPAGDTYGGDPNGGCNACHVRCGASNDYICSAKLVLGALSP
jgi:hypothetical protein